MVHLTSNGIIEANEQYRNWMLSFGEQTQVCIVIIDHCYYLPLFYLLEWLQNVSILLWMRAVVVKGWSLHLRLAINTNSTLSTTRSFRCPSLQMFQGLFLVNSFLFFSVYYYIIPCVINRYTHITTTTAGLPQKTVVGEPMMKFILAPPDQVGMVLLTPKCLSMW